MKGLSTKASMFLFLAVLFSERTNELGVLTGALTGTVLLWPLYRRLVSGKPTRDASALEEAPK